MIEKEWIIVNIPYGWRLEPVLGYIKFDRKKVSGSNRLSRKEVCEVTKIK